MARTEILPDWIASYIQHNLAEHMHIINVLPVDAGPLRGAYLLNTSKGAVVVQRARLGETKHWFLPLPGHHFTFGCHRCGEVMELVDPQVPRKIYCSACGLDHDLTVRDGELTAVRGQKAAATPAAPEPVEPDAYKHGDYTLHRRRVSLKGGGTQSVYFFAKSKPKSGSPCAMPDGYEVEVNAKTGLPFLRKAGRADQCGALTAAGGQCLNAARQGSKYCLRHKGYQPPSAKTVAARGDTAPRAKGAADSKPGEGGDQCAALTGSGVQCTNRSRDGSKYCGTHKGYRKRSAGDTKPRAGIRDTKPTTRKASR